MDMQCLVAKKSRDCAVECRTFVWKRAIWCVGSFFVSGLHLIYV